MGLPPLPQCIAFVGPSGTIAKLYCPFIAYCMGDVGPLKRFTFVTVQAIRTTEQGYMVFIIQGQAYYITNFRVLIELH
jgi:hypothetical protein